MPDINSCHKVKQKKSFYANFIKFFVKKDAFYLFGHKKMFNFVAMKTELLLVGKTNNRNFQAAIDDYIGRIGHYMQFHVTVIPELKNTKALTEVQQKEREGECILKCLQPSDTLVLLDERGSEFRSVEFAAWLEKRQQTARRLVFCIGGPYGFAQDVYARANDRISLSRMTFSHQMVRLVFAEALYRACTIIKGEPYHHE